MTAQVEELGSDTVRLKVDVPAHDVHHAVEHATSDLAQSVKIPGFRQGKVPVPILTQRLGKERIMAEAFARMAGVDADSAGSRPSGKVNPKAIEAMRELGYDLLSHHSKSLDDLPDIEFDVAVTMGCGDVCPVLPGTSYVDWGLDDPAGMSLEQVRELRDEIEQRVVALAGELDSARTGSA